MDSYKVGRFVSGNKIVLFNAQLTFQMMFKLFIIRQGLVKNSFSNPILHEQPLASECTIEGEYIIKYFSSVLKVNQER